MFFNVIVILFNNSYHVNLNKMPFFLLLTLVTLSATFKILYTNIKSDLTSKTISIIRKATQIIS
jgi:hypothetical protein